MEFYINETSLEGQYKNQEEFKKAIIHFMSLVSLLNEKKQLSSATYKPDNNLFLSRKVLENEHFAATLGRLNVELQEAFKGVIFAKMSPKDWTPDTKQGANSEYYFYEGKDKRIVSGSSIAEVAERNLQDKETLRALLNFASSPFAGKTSIDVFKDKEENAITVITLDTKEGLAHFLDQHLKAFSLLEDKTRFKKRKEYFIKSGRSTPTYKEIKTGRIWYADLFHLGNKFHFEVFNAQGEHYREADEEGNLIPGTQDKSKRIKV